MFPNYLKCRDHISHCNIKQLNSDLKHDITKHYSKLLHDNEEKQQLTINYMV